MRALVITIDRERWIAGLTNHWHIVDTAISRHVVGAVENVYAGFVEVREYEWQGDDNPTCAGCGIVLGWPLSGDRPHE